MDQHDTSDGNGMGPGHIVLNGDTAPPKKGGGGGGAVPPPQFSTHVYCGKKAERIKMPLGTEVGLGSVDFVLDGDPTPKKATRPPFSTRLYCDQRNVYISMPLGTEVGLNLVDIVLDGKKVHLP